MSTNEEFEKWFKEQQDKGLVDLKLSVLPVGELSEEDKARFREHVQNEVLKAERAITEGRLGQPPVAKEPKPEERAMFDFLKGVKLRPRSVPITLSEEDYAKWRKQVLLGLYTDEGHDDPDPDRYTVADRLASAIFVDSHDSDQSVRYLRRFVPAIEAQLTKTWSAYWQDEAGNEIENIYDDYMLITMILIDKDLFEYGTSPRCCWVDNPEDEQPFCVTDDESPSLKTPADTYAYLATVCRMARELFESLKD